MQQWRKKTKQSVLQVGFGSVVVPVQILRRENTKQLLLMFAWLHIWMYSSGCSAAFSTPQWNSERLDEDSIVRVNKEV